MTWTRARGIRAGLRRRPGARGGQEAPGSGGAGAERFVRGLGAPQVRGAIGKEAGLGVLDGGGAQGPVTVGGRRPEGPRREMVRVMSFQRLRAFPGALRCSTASRTLLYVTEHHPDHPLHQHSIPVARFTAGGTSTAPLRPLDGHGLTSGRTSTAASDTVGLEIGPKVGAAISGGGRDDGPRGTRTGGTSTAPRRPL